MLVCSYGKYYIKHLSYDYSSLCFKTNAFNYYLASDKLQAAEYYIFCFSTVANVHLPLRIKNEPSLTSMGLLLSKALACMNVFLYKQKWLFYQGDGYLWPYCCMNNLQISHR